MNKVLPALCLLPIIAWGADKSPDEDFYESAAQGGMAEVELGKLAQAKGESAAVKEFGAMMVKDHAAANAKLKGIATKKGVELPTSPSLGQMATKGKLEILSGETFDKSYIKGMVKDHQDTIELFEEEAKEGKDLQAKGFATSTLPTLRAHLKHVQGIATKMGVDKD